MLGFIATAVSIAAAGLAKHYADLNKVESAKAEKEKEVEELKQKLMDLESEKLVDDLDTLVASKRNDEKTRKAETYDYMDTIAWIMDKRKELIADDVESRDPEAYKHFSDMLDGLYENNEKTRGMYRPEGVTDEDIYRLFRSVENTSDKEVAATRNSDSDDE